MVKAEKRHSIEIVATDKPQQDDINTFRRHVLDWYDKNRRVLPWRALTGEKADPYHVWLSEIMLQQTVVNAVIPYFLKFIQMWPSVHDLAQAENDDVMKAWAGLGYYARARNLHKCAKIVSEEFGGMFPSEQKALQALPGIGDYTSAAIRAMAISSALWRGFMRWKNHYHQAKSTSRNLRRIMPRLERIEPVILRKH